MAINPYTGQNQALSLGGLPQQAGAAIGQQPQQLDLSGYYGPGGAGAGQLGADRLAMQQAQQGTPVSTQPVGGATQYIDPNAGMGAQQTAGGQSLANYWQQHPGSMTNAIKQNPGAWGADPNQTARSPMGTPYMANGLPRTGLLGSEMAMEAGWNAADANMQQGVSNAANSMQQGINQVQGTVNPYTQGGAGAFNLQAALSGAQGQAAQQQAYSNYMESPGTAYLREQGEKAITRNSSATGGLGGGNVLQELQRHGMGIAAQDFNDSFNRLGSLSQMGQNSAHLVAGLQGQAGMNNGQYDYNAGSNLASMAYGTGQNLATGRTNAGNRIADAVQGTTSSLANLVNQQQSDLSQIIGANANNQAQLLQGYGNNDAQLMQQLASLLSNQSIGQSSQVAGLSPVGGLVQPNQTLNTIGQIASGVGTAFSGYQQAPQTQVQQIPVNPAATAPTGSLYNGNFNAQSGF